MLCSYGGTLYAEPQPVQWHGAPLPSLYEQATDLIQQADGKLVLAGFFTTGKDADRQEAWILVRYGGDGVLDRSFGDDGRVVALGGMATGVMQQEDGKLVTAGGLYDSGEFSLIRYKLDGTLDKSFGAGGIATLTIGDRGRAQALIQQRDGHLVAVGTSSVGGNSDFAVVRYNRDGSVDERFGVGGQATVQIPGGWAFDVLQQSDGKLVAVGRGDRAGNPGPNCENRVPRSCAFVVVRYEADGSPDRSFGTNGTIRTSVKSSNGAYEVLQQSDGKLVVAGGASDDSPLAHAWVIVRYNLDGTPDTSFGDRGIVTRAFDSVAVVETMVQQATGKRVVAGRAKEHGVLARYNADGGLDTSFGNGGMIDTSLDLVGGLIETREGTLAVSGDTLSRNPRKLVLSTLQYGDDGQPPPPALPKADRERPLGGSGAAPTAATRSSTAQ
jgi:uncharacterized delta-60 repeat protein